MAYKKKEGMTSATSNGFDKRRNDAIAAGHATKRGKSAKTVVQKYISEHPDKIEKIIESCIERAEKGDIDMAQFLVQQGAWLKDDDDVSLTLNNPVFVISGPVEEPEKIIDGEVIDNDDVPTSPLNSKPNDDI